MSGSSRSARRGPLDFVRPFLRSGLKPTLLLASAMVLFAACGKREATPAGGRAAPVLRVSQRNEPADLDPATATLPDEFFVLGALSEGLLVPDPTGGTPLPGAAERYEISADGLTYTFHLRADAAWSDGTPVTADDFVASYRRLLSPTTAAPKASLFFAVKNARAFATGAVTEFASVGFRAIDAHTLAITLGAPMARFPYYVASGPWLPANPRAVQAFGRTWTQPGHFVGNGMFTLTEWRAQQRIVVQKNPRYRDAAHVRLAGIEFIRMDNDEAEERAYRAGQIDVSVTVPRTKVAVYARERPAELHRAPTAETRFLTFNTRRAPLDQPDVRRALSLALDRQKLVERVLLGGQEPATRFIPPPLRLPQEPVPNLPPFGDASEARHLLAGAGFPEGKNFPRLEIAAWSPSQIPVLEAMQAMWRQELGIDVGIATREAKVLLAALPSGDYDIAFATTLTLLDVNDPVALLENFTSTAANNFPRWQSPEFDRLIASAIVERDTTRQAMQLSAAEALLLDASPVAPLYFNARNWLMSPRVHGWQEDALWTRSYLNIYLDEN